MKKDDFIFTLNAICREMTCMSEESFDETFRDDCIQFVRYSHGKPEKTTTKISMKKMPVDSE